MLPVVRPANAHDRYRRTLGGAPTTREAGWVDGWELLTLVANGALTQVYRARPSVARSSAKAEYANTAGYAVKVLRAVWANEPAAVATIAREAAVASAVQHRHLISVLGVRSDAPPYYLVTPWLAGTTLNRRLQRSGAVAPAQAFWYARQTAEALAALHAAGWLHGDVKPANVMVSPAGHVTLLDLGFARALDDLRSQRPWPVLGTPNYLAPEALGSVLRLSAASDLYSLGVMLYELLTGTLPIAAGDIDDFCSQLRTLRPRNVRELLPQLPREAVELLALLLAKEPLRRPSSAQEVVETLRRLEIQTLDMRV